MKKILLSSLLACSLFANDENFIELGFGQIQMKDNFSTENSKNISALNNAKEEKENFPYVSFFYGYDLTPDMKIYATSSTGDLNIGSQFTTDVGIFDLGFTYNKDEAWENPYLLNTNRKETDVEESGFYLAYGTNLTDTSETSIVYQYTQREYDKDLLLGNLKRDGNRHVLALEHNIISKLFDKDVVYITNLSLEEYEADGKANSYEKLELALGLNIQATTKLDISLLTNFAQKDYDALNTQVNKKVSSDTFGLTAIVNYQEPFDVKNTYVSFKTGFEEEDANANFYDKENNFAMLSIGYTF